MNVPQQSIDFSNVHARLEHDVTRPGELSVFLKRIEVTPKRKKNDEARLKLTIMRCSLQTPIYPFSACTGSISISPEPLAAQIMAYATTAYQVPTLEESVLHDDDTIIPINEEINKGVDIAKIKQSSRTRKAIGVFAKSLKHFRTFVDDLKGTQDDLPGSLKYP